MGGNSFLTYARAFTSCFNKEHPKVCVLHTEAQGLGCEQSPSSAEAA